ncbi:MAG TPA: exodeoxyribonuclease V subunit alpha [Rhabdochlamydiaceae bacterium]|nr:exodeoxyribonuclease V subunit alpha [Rhabdochlamydiaceae bacterium]
MRWPSLWQLVEKKQLLYLDYLFAEKVCPEGSEDEAAFVAALMAHSRKGHICMRAQDGAKPYPSIIEQCDDNFYLQKNYIYETSVLEEVKRLLSYSSAASVEESSGPLTAEQKEAVKKAFHYPFSIITGGPGTGKSYTALQIIAAFQKKEEAQIVICAPTGKAASLLESKCIKKVRSGTLHTILNVRTPLDFAKKVEQLPATLVIVDECSMIDAALFSRLLSAIGPETHLVLMGDSDQLPAVESGSFFADLVEAAKEGYPIPYTNLSLCLRSDQSEILNLAAAIRKGEQNFYHHATELDPETLWDEIKKNFPMPTSLKPESEILSKQMNHFRILSAMRKGPHGVDQINQMVADRMLAAKKSHEYCPLPILITRNDQQLGLFNGEMGFLVKAPSHEDDYAIFDSGRVFPSYLLPSFEYAYCLSVHKSQGSEFDKVILLIPDGSEYFGKELLYTAVTRAKKSLEIYASKEMIRTTLGQSSRKMSGLVKRLNSGFSEMG